MLVFDKYDKTKEAWFPQKKYRQDVGIDLHSSERVVIEPRQQVVVHTNLYIRQAPPNVYFQIWSKSGLDSRYGLHIGAGIVDPGYTGELLVLCKNMSDISIDIHPGNPIAQLIPVAVVPISFSSMLDIRGEDGGITRTVSEVTNEV